MQIIFAVNETEAIRRGHNATSTAKLEVDIPTLTQPEREILSQLVKNGDGREWVYIRGSHTGLMLPEPTLDGLSEAIANFRAKLDAAAIVDAADAEAKKVQAQVLIQKAAALSAEIIAGKIDLKITWNGQRWYSEAVYHGLQGSIDVGFSLLTPAAQECVTAALVRHHAQAALVRHHAQADAEAKKQRTAAQLEAAVTAAGGLLAERRAAGYADNGEIIKLIQDGERARLGLTFTGGCVKWDREDVDFYIGALTDEQFIALKNFRAKLPEGGATKLFDMHDDGRDDPDDDESGRDHAVKLNRIIVAEAAWLCGDVEVFADCQIGELPDITDSE